MTDFLFENISYPQIIRYWKAKHGYNIIVPKWLKRTDNLKPWKYITTDVVVTTNGVEKSFKGMSIVGLKREVEKVRKEKVQKLSVAVGSPGDHQRLDSSVGRGKTIVLLCV